jgi:hypothetical protein
MPILTQLKHTLFCTTALSTEEGLTANQIYSGPIPTDGLSKELLDVLGNYKLCEKEAQVLRHFGLRRLYNDG